jgi:hypothetical protein
MVETTFQLLENETVHDDVFVVRPTRFGLYKSTTVKGRAMLTGADEENVIMMTRWHLKCEQEGWPEGSVRAVGSGFKAIDL